jgi:hypothetical protein
MKIEGVIVEGMNKTGYTEKHGEITESHREFLKVASV